MALPQRIERILLTVVLGLFLMVNLFIIWMYVGFEGKIDPAFALLVVQSCALIICGVLLWTSRATGKLAQYFFIGIGFYLLGFGLCVSIL
jgi:hypothetical protein